MYLNKDHIYYLYTQSIGRLKRKRFFFSLVLTLLFKYLVIMYVPMCIAHYISIE